MTLTSFFSGCGTLFSWVVAWQLRYNLLEWGLTTQYLQRQTTSCMAYYIYSFFNTSNAYDIFSNISSLQYAFLLQIYARMLNLRLNYLFRVGTIIYFNSWFTTTIMYSVWVKFRLRPPPVGIWFCTDPYSTWLWCPINHHHNLLEWVFLQTTTAISTLDTRIADIFFQNALFRYSTIIIFTSSPWDWESVLSL